MAVPEVAVNLSIVAISRPTRHASFGPVLICVLIAATLLFAVEGLVVLVWMLEKGWCVCQLVFLL